MTGFFINPFHPELYQFSDKMPHSVAVAKKKVPGLKVLLGPKDHDEFKQAVAEIAALRSEIEGQIADIGILQAKIETLEAAAAAKPPKSGK